MHFDNSFQKFAKLHSRRKLTTTGQPRGEVNAHQSAPKTMAKDSPQTTSHDWNKNLQTHR